MEATKGASKGHVELPILRCLAKGGWKQAGELKDYVARHARLPADAKRSLKDRGAEPQSHNAVQNQLRSTVKSSLVGDHWLNMTLSRALTELLLLGLLTKLGLKK